MPSSIIDQSVKRYRKIQITLLLTGAVSICLLLVLGYQEIKHSSTIQLKNTIKLTIERADGTVEHSDSRFFAKNKVGDKLIARIPIEERLYAENAIICLNTYNCITEIFFDGKLLQSYGREQAERNKQIGNIFFVIPISHRFWGKELVMELTCFEDGTYATFPDILFVPSAYVGISKPGTNSLVSVIHLVVLICAFFCFIYFIVCIVIGVNENSIMSGFAMSVFIISFELWYLGKTNTLFLVLRNKELCANIEYIMLYFLGIPFSVFIYSTPNILGKMRFSKFWIVFFSFVFSAIMILCQFIGNFYYCNFLSLIMVIYGAYCVYIITGAVIFTRRNRQKILKPENASTNIFINGLTFSLALLAVEILFFSLSNGTQFYSLLIEDIIITFTIFTIASTFSIMFFITNAQKAEAEHERRYMKKLAFTDNMTGIANRLACYEKLREIDEKAITDYAVLFFDSNNLKSMNDKFGHQYGDEMIKYVAVSLSESVGTKGFCGRWGGDEFIACVFTHDGDSVVAEVTGEFKRRIDMANKNNMFPVNISVAYGVSVSTKDVPLTSNTAIEEADKNMYASKSALKRRSTDVTN